MAQRAVYVGKGVPDSSSAPCSFICRCWHGVSCHWSHPAPGDRAHVCSSLSQSQWGFTLSLPCLFSVDIFVSVCFLSLHICISSSSCHLALLVTPSYTHSLLSVWLHPLSLSVFLQLKQQRSLWLRAHCPSQALQNSTVCLSSLHCADLYWLNIHSCFRSTYKCAPVCSLW